MKREKLILDNLKTEYYSKILLKTHTKFIININKWDSVENMKYLLRVRAVQGC